MLSKSPSNLSIVRENEIATGGQNLSVNNKGVSLVANSPIKLFIGTPSLQQSLSPRTTLNMSNMIDKYSKFHKQ